MEVRGSLPFPQATTSTREHRGRVLSEETQGNWVDLSTEHSVGCGKFGCVKTTACLCVWQNKKVCIFKCLSQVCTFQMFVQFLTVASNVGHSSCASFKWLFSSFPLFNCFKGEQTNIIVILWLCRVWKWKMVVWTCVRWWLLT